MIGDECWVTGVSGSPAKLDTEGGVKEAGSKNGLRPVERASRGLVREFKADGSDWMVSADGFKVGVVVLSLSV